MSSIHLSVYGSFWGMFNSEDEIYVKQ